ncbi:hypothetical protein AAC387_Pa04g1181 [Persea americana]
METNGADKVTVSGVGEAECPETMVEIKIKTLDSQIYTLRVNKCMPVPALKDQIATVTGVLSEQQRLICRGKVLKDDQLLSAYHVEDGHTLHLVVRQPFHSSSSTTTGLMGSESTADHPVDPSNGHNRGNHVAHSLVVGTFNMADQRDGAMPDIGRIVSAVLSSFGITNTEGVDLREHSMERLNRASSASGMSDSTQPLSEQTAPRAQSDSLHDAFRSPISVSVGSIPPTVIPDSLTTLFQYLSHLRHEFSAIGRNHNRDAGDVNIDGMEGGGHDGASRSGAGQGLPTPESLAGVMQSTRQMLVEQAAGCLSQLAGQLESHSSLTDPSARMDIQTNAIRSGVLLHNLGALLLELGRTIMTLRMGRTPAEAVVNAGPAVFISTSGPNPIMVQPLPFQPGTSFGAIPMGTPGHGISGGILGSGSGRLPRNIDIRIRRGSSISAASAGQGEQAGARQPPVQPDPAISAGPNLAHQPVSGASGSPSFPGESRVRIVPIRTVYAAVPAALSHPQSDSAGSAAGLFYPLLARFQHLSSGHANVTRGSQSSGESQPSGPETTQQQTTEHAAHQQNLGSNGGAPRREGNGQTVINLSPTDGSSVVSDVNFSADTSGQHLQGDGPQNGQDSTTQITSRFDQLLRTIFPGEQINLSEVNLQARPTGPVMGQTGGNGRDGVASEASGVDMDPGTFFSGLVRQIMPFISQTSPAEVANASSVRAVTAHHNTESDPSTSQTEGETSTEVGNSRRRGDPPSSPSSKRQKTE